jgi:aryl-alcohol dehydrogenase-like predicted oxidoreductase
MAKWRGGSARWSRVRFVNGYSKRFARSDPPSDNQTREHAMKMRELGRTGIQVTEICLGTMTWGDQNSEAEGHTQMDLALERGINFFDTAEMYSVPPKPETQGSTERIIGSWFKKSGARDKIVLATKAAGRGPMTWVRDGDEALLDNGWVRHTQKQLDYAITQSLRRLGTDYIDLYQLHWPDRGWQGFGFQTYKDYRQDWNAFEDILGHIGRHVEAGRVRAFGVSNESPWGVMRFVKAAETTGLPRVASIQNAYNLVNRVFEYGLAETCLREDVSLLAYSPLGQGYLTGKYRDGALPEGSRKSLFNRLQRYEGPGAEAQIDRYLDLAAELGVTPTQLALKFCATRAFMGSVIIGATSLSQLEECLAAFETPWTEEMEERVNALHASHPNPCP